MGQVWRGRDTLLGRPVAVKVLRSEYTSDPTFLARFRAEAVHAAALSHPNIAAVYDYGEADDQGEHIAYLVMELVEGEALSTRLREEGPLSPEATLSVLRQAATALAEAHHAGLVHRDVKPGNILLCPDERVKITDFGIAWSAGSVPLTQAGQVVGTPQYLSPEVAVGEPPSPASDVYSLGLVGYECLTGEPAFDGDNPVCVALKQVQEEPEPLPGDLPAGLRELVVVAVAKDPAERPPDGDAFLAAIDRVQAGRPLDHRAPTTRAPLIGAPAVPARSPHPAGRPDRRRRTLLAAVLALLVGVGVVVLLALPGGGGSPVGGASVAGASEQDQPIVLVAADYLGRPVDDVATELSGLGLTVARQQQVTGAAAPGAVTGLDPVGQDLRPGDAVTVSFAAPPPARQPHPVGDAPVQAAGPDDSAGGGVGSSVAITDAGGADVGSPSGTSPAGTDTGAASGPADLSAAPSSAEGSTSEAAASGSAAATGSSTGGGEPATSEPETSAPVTSEPATSEPATSEPATSEPATSEPVTSEPATSEPATS